MKTLRTPQRGPRLASERGAFARLARWALAAPVASAAALWTPCAAHAAPQVSGVLVPATPARAGSAIPASGTVEAVQIQEEGEGGGGDAVPGATPAPPGAVAGVAAAPPPFTPKELERLRAVFNAASDQEKAALRAIYQDMGVDLAAALGFRAGGGRPLPEAVRALNFARRPEAVLAARSQLSMGAATTPDRANSEAVARWLHQNVLAGEWGVLSDFFSTVPPDAATAIYSHILRSTNEGGQGLLPEEVLALADACPGEMAEWQLDVLGQMLKASAAKYGTGPFLERLKQGTRFFGAGDDASRERTMRLLVGAGLALQAAEFLPPLEDARARGDARALDAHARYELDLAQGASDEEAAQHLRKGWDLLCEVSLLPGAEVPLRREAMRKAIELLLEIPPAQGREWLGKVFANESLGPAAIELVALQAMNMGKGRADPGRRAQGVATMKAALDTLLATQDIRAESLRVPLRMLTTAMADEVEATVGAKGDLRGVAPETELLFRAAPDERWLEAVEPSVGIRGWRAAMSIATLADETDAALDVLAAAVKHHPAQGKEFANDFLKLWERRLNPKGREGFNEWDNPFIIYYGQQRGPSAPLTRGRQRRNLERLERLLTIVEGLGIRGRELPGVTSAFQACHARTEVFDRDEVERVFGPIDQMPASTAAALAESMKAGLGGDWRNRQVQQSFGMSRSAAEIGDLVDAGYDLAIQLASRAVALEPDSWRNAVLHAALSYDRVQFEKAQKKTEFAKFAEYRRQAFAAFERASRQYRELVARGAERDNAGVYVQWFAALLDLGQAPAGSEEAGEDAAATDDQVERIRASILSLPEEAAQRHMGMFARQIVEALEGVPPEKKPTIVRSAVRIVGDHPAGAPLRRLNELYEDLLKNEIRLRLAVDGSDRVGAGQPFGVPITLRYTNSVDRETGGFDKYLYQDAYVRVGNQYRMINYQGQIQKAIERAFGKGYQVEALGFFDPLTPSRSVREDGQPGWQEKPLAYAVVKAKDASIDRLPQVSFDMHFDDQAGAVTLPILSNAPPVDASAAAPRRPLLNLKVQQTVDLRRLQENTGDRAVTLEVSATGDGVIPEVRTLLAGLDGALAGYSLADADIESRPYNVVQTEGGGRSRMFFGSSATPEKKEYPKADENGIFRLPSERSWMLTFRPTGGAVGSAFELPTLASGVEGAIVSRQYADMDVVDVKTPGIPVTPRWSTTTRVAVGAGGALLVAGAGLLVWWRRRSGGRQGAVSAGFRLPERITPLSTIAALERLARHAAPLPAEERAALERDIRAIEAAWFGPAPRAGSGEGSDGEELRRTLERWAREPALQGAAARGSPMGE